MQSAEKKLRKLTVTESAVFYLVFSLIKRFGGETYVKQGTVAARLGLARETVCRVIKRLKARGLLKVRQRSVAWNQGGRRLISCVYSVGKHWCDRGSQQSSAQSKKDDEWLAVHMARVISGVETVAPVLGVEGLRLRQAENRLRLRRWK